MMGSYDRDRRLRLSPEMQDGWRRKKVRRSDLCAVAYFLNNPGKHGEQSLYIGPADVNGQVKRIAMSTN